MRNSEIVGYDFKASRRDCVYLEYYANGEPKP